MSSVPYFSQFASRHLVSAFLAQPALTATDPLWRESGWQDPEQYAFWAWRTCGVACLRSVLGVSGTPPTPADLTGDLIDAGGYVHDPRSSEVRGLVYQPFVEYVEQRWGLKAEVVRDVEDAQLPRLLAGGRVMLASVAPGVRDLATDGFVLTEPPGGHLVLVLEADTETVRFHNPSGRWPNEQDDVALPTSNFARAFAGRGVLLQTPTPPGRQS